MTSPVRIAVRTALVVLAVLAIDSPSLAQAAKSSPDAYAFAFTDITGAPLPMSTFAGKTVLLVNTASLCGFTPQYEGLQRLYERYRDRGLIVLGVPSNDFGGQEPGNAAEIKEFCAVNFAITFPLTEKEHVRGAAAHPLYRWLAQRLGPQARPGWNFHKILIGPDGQPIAAWPSRVRPNAPDLVARIESVLIDRR